MSFMDLAKNRYSCRAFTAQAVEPEKLAQVLEAGRLSPTAINAQPVTVKVIKSPEALEKIRGITRMAYNAPVVLMVCYDEPKCYTAEKYNDNFSALKGSSNQRIIFFDEKYRKKYEKYLTSGRTIQNFYMGKKLISVGIHNKE